MFFEVLRVAFRALTIAWRVFDLAGALRQKIGPTTPPPLEIARALRKAASEASELVEDLEQLSNTIDGEAVVPSQADRAVS
jgi:hypothetical protein